MNYKILPFIVLVACASPRVPEKAQCFRDSENLTWTNEALMTKYDKDRSSINEQNVCYPDVELSERQISGGVRCPNPRQRLDPDGRCVCDPYPDVLFRPDDIKAWCQR